MVLTVLHPPRLKIDKVLFFYINESAIYADLDEQRKRENHHYTALSYWHAFWEEQSTGRSFGRLTSQNRRPNRHQQTASIKPTLHLVAIGINDFILGPERRLLNPVRDAQLEQIFFEKETPFSKPTGYATVRFNL